MRAGGAVRHEEMRRDGPRRRAFRSWTAAARPQLVETHEEGFLVWIDAANCAQEADVPRVFHRQKLCLKRVDSGLEVVIRNDVVLHHDQSWNFLVDHLFPDAEV